MTLVLKGISPQDLRTHLGWQECSPPVLFFCALWVPSVKGALVSPSFPPSSKADASVLQMSQQHPPERKYASLPFTFTGATSPPSQKEPGKRLPRTWPCREQVSARKVCARCTECLTFQREWKTAMFSGFTATRKFYFIATSLLLGRERVYIFSGI